MRVAPDSSLPRFSPACPPSILLSVRWRSLMPSGSKWSISTWDAVDPRRCLGAWAGAGWNGAVGDEGFWPGSSLISWRELVSAMRD